MPHVLALLMLTLVLHFLWASRNTTFDQEALDTALTLAGLDRANLPITLATAPPASASRGIEAWTDRQRGAVAVIQRSDDPADEILRYAKTAKIDLIVMGTHGRTGLARIALGSVAEAVVRAAPCPVLTVHSAGCAIEVAASNGT